MPDTEGLTGAEPYTQEEILGAKSRMRDRELGKLLTLLFGSAIDAHKEEIKRALGYVFDTQAVEEHTAATKKAIHDLKEMLRKANHEANRAEHRFGSLNKRLDEIEGRMAKVK